MMKKHFIAYLSAVALLLCSMLFSCKPQDNPSDGQGSIYGTITDYATSEPVNGANVQLRPSGETTLTGSDGRYEFLAVPCGTYSIKVTKEGYSDLIDDYDIVVTDGKETKRDVQIKKLPSSIHIYDNESHEISELDFGADEGVTQKTFNIFNGGSQSLNYIIQKSADWISNISQPTGTIGVGVTYPIVITIDRELLSNGNNTTTLLITSSTEGGKELTIKARKSSSGDGVYELPTACLMVQTEDLGTVDWSSAKLLCENSTVAGFNDWRLPTLEELMTLYSNREAIGGFVDDKYWSSSMGYSYHYYVNFNDGISNCATSSIDRCYVRAVRTITNVSQNDVMELPTSNLMVQTQDLGNGQSWNAANLMCESSDLAGYTDWRLPTINELMTLYNNKDLIGGFQNSYYWSSTKENGNYRLVDFSDGSLGTSYWVSTANIRAVRSLNGNASTVPEVQTTSPSSITTNSATCGGNVTSDGGASIIQRGVCYSTSQNPNTSNQIVTSGTGIGSFTCNLTGLTANTTYYVRAYAINSVGTAYGEQKSFTTTSGGGGGGGQTFTYTFENGAEDWNVIDVDGDGYNWGRYVGDGYNSDYYVSSASYVNDKGALTPDNYLYTPERIAVTNGAKISFYVCAQDADWPAEHYGVAVATVAGTPSANNFNTIWSETLSAKVKKEGKIRGTSDQGTWYMKTIDLSAYAGQSIWIAIRHFNCTDQYMLNVDNITIFTGN